MHNALAVANYFIQAAKSGGLATRDFPPSKVHGLVYLANGWMLGSAGTSIVAGKIAADKDGVFIPELRDAGCAGTKNVTELVSVIKMDEARGVMTEQTPMLTPQNATVQALAWIWKTYGPLSSFRISEHIKEPGSPWDSVWHQPGRKGEEAQPIPNAMIKAWFRGLQGKRAEQERHCKLSQTQKLEKTSKFEKTLPRK
jgi:uncharacterized phage-associated protein